MTDWLNIREARHGLVMIGIGLAFFLSSFSIDVLNDGGIAPRVFPMAASLLIAGLGLLQLLLARTQSNQSNQSNVTITDKADESSPSVLIGMIALSIGYTLGINYVGYLVATACAAPFAFYLFGIRSKIGLALAFFLCPAIFHLIFFYGLGVFPPYGLWFDLLDLIQA